MLKTSTPGSVGKPAGSVLRVRLVAFAADGCLIVQTADGQEFACDWLDSGAARSLELNDDLLAIYPSGLLRGVVLGRVGPYAVPAVMLLESTQAVTLKCGSAEIELRANGDVAVKGDDVLIRAKGTQRIRAGNVAIN